MSLSHSCDASDILRKAVNFISLRGPSGNRGAENAGKKFNSSSAFSAPLLPEGPLKLMKFATLRNTLEAL